MTWRGPRAIAGWLLTVLVAGAAALMLAAATMPGPGRLGELGGRRRRPAADPAPDAPAPDAPAVDAPAPRPRLPRREIALVALWSMAVPLFVYTSLGVVSMSALTAMLVFVATCYLLIGLSLGVEGALALPRRQAHGPDGAALPRTAVDRPVTALVLAYLPNEQEIIVETVTHLLEELDVPSERLQVVLAYNTPTTLLVEAELQRLARRDPRLVLVRVPDSTTKAANVNAALRHVTGEVTAIFDADHRPEPDAFAKALRWLDAGYDAVQGRCVIRNHEDNLLTRLVGVEFASMYAVAHSARSLAFDTALFGGSNGYWRTELLRDLRMDPQMLTEDIDLTLRALLGGARIVHDRSILATELAPVRPVTWFFQRLRWAQGWYQVTRRHARAIGRSRELSRAQRLCWLYLLPWRETIAAIAPQAVGMIIAIGAIHLVYGIAWHWNLYLTGTTIVTLAGGLITTLAAGRHLRALRRTRRRDIVYYVLLAPLFVQVKNFITLVGWVREWREQVDWVPTSRAGAGTARPQALDAGAEADSTPAEATA